MSESDTTCVPSVPVDNKFVRLGNTLFNKKRVMSIECDNSVCHVHVDTGGLRRFVERISVYRNDRPEDYDHVKSLYGKPAKCTNNGRDWYPAPPS